MGKTGSQETLVLWALKEKEALRVNQVQKVKKEEQEKMALMEHLVSVAREDHKVHKAMLEQQALLEDLAKLVQQEPRETEVTLVSQVPGETQEGMENGDILERLDHQGLLEKLVHEVPLACLVHLEFLVMLVLLAHGDPLATLDFLAKMVQMVPLVPREPQAQWETKESRELLEIWVTQDQKETSGPLDLKALTDPLVPLELWEQLVYKDRLEKMEPLDLLD